MALNLKAFVTLDGRGFAAGAAFIERQANSLASKVGAYFTAGAIATGLVSLSRKTINFADDIGDLSRRLEISTDFLQRFQYAAIKSGASVEDLRSVIEQLNVSRLEALGGNKEAIAAFRQLGIGQSDLRQGSDKLVMTIAEAFEKGSAQQLLPAFKSIGGRAAGALVATFKDGLSEEMTKAPIIPPETIAAIKIVKDEFTAMAQVLAVEFAPALVKISREVVKAAYLIKTGFLVMTFQKDKAEREVFKLQEFLLDFDEKVKTTAAALASPTATPLFRAITSQSAEKIEANAAEIPSDALVRVGNFLGSNQNTVQAIGQETNKWLRSIDNRLYQILSKQTTEDGGFPL